MKGTVFGEMPPVEACARETRARKTTAGVAPPVAPFLHLLLPAAVPAGVFEPRIGEHRLRAAR